MKSILKTLFWAVYRITPKGKKAWKFKKGFEGLMESKRSKDDVKLNVVHTAYKNMKKKKILAFKKGQSVSKAKSSDHQIRESAKAQHKEELKERGIKISKKGKFQNA